jgi:microcompartment protein CcmK/EutM
LFVSDGAVVEAVEFGSADCVCDFSAGCFFLSSFLLADSSEDSARRSASGVAVGAGFDSFGLVEGASPASVAFSSEAGPTRTPSTWKAAARACAAQSRSATDAAVINFFMRALFLDCLRRRRAAGHGGDGGIV